MIARVPPVRAATLAMVGVAVFGSMFYGASLSRAVGSDALGTALWLTICAGLGWAALIPALTVASRLPLGTVLSECLISICFGEAVLAMGALLNYFGFASGVGPNAVVVLVSNVVMAVVLAVGLARRGCPAWKTLALWLFALDGVGASAFWALRFLLGGVGA